MTDDQKEALNSVQAILQEMVGTCFRAALNQGMSNDQKVRFKARLEWLVKKIDEA